MARLPQPGGDENQWGDILNDYLQQAHAADGTLKTDSVGAAQLRPLSVTTSAVNDASITEAKLDSSLQTKIQNADSILASLSPVATSGSYTDLINTPTIPAASVTSVATKTGDVVLDKSDVGLSQVDNTSDAAKPISSATQTALDAKVTGPTGATDYSLARFDGATGKLLKSSAISVDDSGNLALPDGAVLTVGTTTGTKVGTATTQKIGFFNATPVAQQAATTDLGTAFSNLGLRAAGTAYPINTSASSSFTGTSTTITNVLATSVRMSGLVRTGTSFALTSTSVNFNNIDASAGSYTVTLPSTTTAGFWYTIKKVDSSANPVTIVGTIDGATNYTLTKQYELITVVSTTTSGVWYIVSPDLLAERTAQATLTNKSLTSPTLTGVPTAPTATANTNSTQVATTAYADTIKAGALGVVVHGATASATRPSGYAQVTWIGSVQPTNALANDIWMYKP